MDLMKKFGTDPKASLEGVWCPLGDDAEFKIARLNNSVYREYMAARAREYKREPTDAESKTLLNEALAEAVLLGWRGEIVINGEPLEEYSKPAAVKLLSNPYLPDFKEWVLSRAGDMKTFRMEALEDDLGNS